MNLVKSPKEKQFAGDQNIQPVQASNNTPNISLIFGNRTTKDIPDHSIEEVIVQVDRDSEIEQLRQIGIEQTIDGEDRPSYREKYPEQQDCTIF